MYNFNHKLLLWILCVIKSHSHISVGHMISKWWNGNNMKGVNFSCLYFVYMASMIDDKVTWMFNCHSPMWQGKNHYDYDYKMIMYNDVNKYLQLMWILLTYIVLTYIVHYILLYWGFFWEVWHAITCLNNTAIKWLYNDSNRLQVIWYEDKQTYPPPPIYILAYLSTPLPTNTPTYLLTTHLHAS
jgi:hypothetical protein